MRLSTTAISEIKAFIDTELLKRGIIVKTSLEERETTKGDRTRLYLSSTSFQTVPVLFRDLSIDGTSSIPLGEPIDELELPVYDICIGVHLSYELFSRGRNGTELFTMAFKVSGNSVYGARLII